jgi:hypothetical protein
MSERAREREVKGERGQERERGQVRERERTGERRERERLQERFRNGYQSSSECNSATGESSREFKGASSRWESSRVERVQEFKRGEFNSASESFEKPTFQKGQCEYDSLSVRAGPILKKKVASRG